jgi:hypothetical protein
VRITFVANIFVGKNITNKFIKNIIFNSDRVGHMNSETKRRDKKRKREGEKKDRESY